MKGQNRRPMKGKAKPKGRSAQRYMKDFEDKNYDVRSSGKLQDEKINDPRWYAQNPQLMKDYASFPFGFPLGVTIDGGEGSRQKGYGVPGVCTINLAPSIGYATTPNDPVNMAMRNTYTFVRRANSGATNYEAPDLMMYILSVTNVLAYIEFLKRTVGLMMAYTALNRYYPKALVQSAGWDFNDVQNNIVQLRGYINQMAVKAQSLVIPNSLSYVARQAWLYSKVILDSNTDKAQSYQFVPTGFFTYPGDSDQPTSLVFTRWLSGIQATTGNTVAQAIAFGDAMINPILQSQAFNVMSGDILKAYGNQGVITIMGVSDTYITLPEYSTEVQSQIENLTICGSPVSGYGVTQDTTVNGGFLVSKPQTIAQLRINSAVASTEETAVALMNEVYQPVLGGEIQVNFHHNGVEPEDVMVATRLTNMGRAISANKVSGQWEVTLEWPTTGSEFVTSIQMAMWSDGTNQSLINETDAGFYNVGIGSSVYTTRIEFSSMRNGDSDITVSNVQQDINTYANGMASAITEAINTSNLAFGMLSTFDWHPRVYPATIVYARYNTRYAEGGITNVQSFQILPGWPQFDYDVYTPLTTQNLSNLSAVALLSEFGTPI